MGIDSIKQAVFLDRDGVINEVVVRANKISSPHGLVEFKLIQGAQRPLQRFRESGFFLIIVTNQPDIARGKIDIPELERMHAVIHAALPIDAIYTCMHDAANGCECRKPKPGMLFMAAQRYHIDMGQSYMIGDGWKDVEVARNAKCTPILMRKYYNHDTDCPNIVNDLDEAADLILHRGR